MQSHDYLLHFVFNRVPKLGKYRHDPRRTEPTNLLLPTRLHARMSPKATYRISPTSSDDHARPPDLTRTDSPVGVLDARMQARIEAAERHQFGHNPRAQLGIYGDGIA